MGKFRHLTIRIRNGVKPKKVLIKFMSGKLGRFQRYNLSDIDASCIVNQTFYTHKRAGRIRAKIYAKEDGLLELEYSVLTNELKIIKAIGVFFGKKIKDDYVANMSHIEFELADAKDA